MRTEQDEPENSGDYDRIGKMDVEDEEVADSFKNKSIPDSLEMIYEILKILADGIGENRDEIRIMIERSKGVFYTMKSMERTIEKLVKDRKSDQAVIHKLLREIKISKIRTEVKSVPTPGKDKKVGNARPFKKRRKRKPMDKDGWKSVGKRGQSGARYRKKLSTERMEVDVEAHFPQQSWSEARRSQWNETSSEAPDTPIARDLKRKRVSEGSPEEKVLKKRKADDDEVIRMPRANVGIERLPALNLLKDVDTPLVQPKILSEKAIGIRKKLDKHPDSIEDEDIPMAW